MNSEIAGLFLFDETPEDNTPANTFMVRTDGRSLSLIGDLDFSSVVQAHERLSAGRFETIDLSGLRTCDGAGLQLLLWARLASERAGAPVKFVGGSGAIRGSLALAGLA